MGTREVTVSKDEGIRADTTYEGVAKIRPAIVATVYEGERSAKNPEFVTAVARANVLMCVEEIREGSRVLRELEEKGEIRIVGAMYDLDSGVLTLA